MMKNYRIALLLVVGMFGMSGCITSRSPDCVGFTMRLPNGKEEKSIAYSFIRTGNLSVQKDFNPTSSMASFSGAWVGAQTEAAALGQFRGVFEPAAKSITPTTDRNGGSCEIMLTVHQQNVYNPLVVFPAFLHGLTLCCIPCWGDDVYYLNVIAQNNVTGLKKEYTIRRNITTTSWLPLIFAMPFGELPITAMSHITMENWKELRCKMEDDGFFDKTNLNQNNDKKISGDDVAIKFENLRRLKKQGVLTEEEYDRAIERIK